jgi:hypothetical protein
MNALGNRRTTIMAALICLSPAALFAQTTEPPVKPPVKLPVAVPKPAVPPAVKPPATAPTSNAHPAAAPSNTPPAARPATPPVRPATNPGVPGANTGRPGTPAPGINHNRPIETTTHTPHGDVIHGPHNEVRAVRARGMDIRYGPGGSRTIVGERPDHALVVSNRRGYGYIQRPYVYHGANFVQRTYYVNGVTYAGFYRPYTFGGVGLNVYAPAYYYPTPFYTYAYYPWGVPIAYSWGWAGSPWYGYYGGYFTPYPVYASPSLWLTDYMMAQTLQAAYQAQADQLANAQAYPAPLTPDVKQQIADEVRSQITLENAEAAAGAQTAPNPGSSGVQRMLTDNTAHVFVVSAPMVVQSTVGECSITEGDVLRLNLGPRPDPSTANLVVLASKGQDCPKATMVAVGVADLQDMQNHMRETIDQGLADLQKKQGQNGIPAAPAGAAAPPVQTGYAALAPPPYPNTAAELRAQTIEADGVQQEVLGDAGPGGPNAGQNLEPVERSAPKTPLTLNQTPEEVIAILGQPQNIVDMGAKKIYLYPNLKVTFTDGKVSAFQ